MRKIIGLCFVTVTLLAGSARAQSIFIERGDPSTMSATVGGGLVRNAWDVSVDAAYSYRGVFDVGVEFTRYAYTAGYDKNLAGYGFMPFLSWHFLRSDADDMPISLSFIFGAQRILYAGNGPHTNPEGYGILAGPSVYRRFEFGTSLVFIPELLAAYDFQYTRRYSTALDQASSNIVNNDSGLGYSTEAHHGVRVLLRPNLVYKAGNTSYLIVPYIGYQGVFAAGGSIGAMF